MKGVRLQTGGRVARRDVPELPMAEFREQISVLARDARTQTVRAGGSFSSARD